MRLLLLITIVCIFVMGYATLDSLKKLRTDIYLYELDLEKIERQLLNINIWQKNNARVNTVLINRMIRLEKACVKQRLLPQQ